MNISPVKYSVLNKEGVNFGAIRCYRNDKGKIDSFEIQKENNNKNMTIKTGIAAAFLAAMTAIGYQGSTSNVVSIPASQITSISDLSDTYEISPDVIIDYNSKFNNEKEELKIPSKFTYLDDKEAELNEKLHKRFLSDEKRIETEKEIKNLRRKRETQNFMADVYCDDDYVYFKLHITGKDNPNDKNLKLVAENFKHIFDIKDGALREHNDLNFEWKSQSLGDITGQYQDYTHALLQNGETYKVKKSDIEYKNN